MTHISTRSSVDLEAVIDGLILAGAQTFNPEEREGWRRSVRRIAQALHESDSHFSVTDFYMRVDYYE